MAETTDPMPADQRPAGPVQEPPSGAADVIAAGARAQAPAVLRVSAELVAAAQEAAAETARLVAAAISERGAAHVALTGGSGGEALAGVLPDALAEAGVSRDGLASLHLWFGDERYVPAGDPERNDILVAPFTAAGVPEANVHRVAGPDLASTLEESARRLAEELRTEGPEDGALDVVHLGMGPDAHVCSLFPGHPAALALGTDVVAVEDSPKPPPRRVSLTFEVLQRARCVMVVAGGAGKVDAVAKALGEADPVAAPASCARGAVTSFYLDEAAAAGAPGEVDGAAAS
ncbi:6-phosphogluconolactonase [Actinomyces haliotis]|uniref:6-phosphogluconolactonase n=1 Tax=Actinomyces haliotis TaxID=1280843 RepID=UPI002B2743FC|nr:6-phosphogluconolactonase [Actinomyces haliotis]